MQVMWGGSFVKVDVVGLCNACVKASRCQGKKLPRSPRFAGRQANLSFSLW